MKMFIILGCLLISFESRCDLPSIVLCLGEFETIDGTTKSYYFNISSDVLYYDGNLEVTNKVLDFTKHKLGSIGIYTRFYDFNCGAKHVYGMSKKDLVENSNLKLNKVKVRYIVFMTMFGCLGILEDSILDRVNSGICNCLNFDVDLYYQDLGGDSIQTFYIFSNLSKPYLKQAVMNIEQSYIKYKENYLENNYNKNYNLFQQFMKDEIQHYNDESFTTIEHYK